MSFQLSFYTLYFFASCQAPHLGGSTLSPRLKCIHVANCIAHSMLYYEGILLHYGLCAYAYSTYYYNLLPSSNEQLQIGKNNIDLDSSGAIVWQRT